MTASSSPATLAASADHVTRGALPQELLQQLPHDRRHLQQYAQCPHGAQFAFGAGDTPLDRFVRNITRRSSREYATQWSAEAWWQAMRMYVTMRRRDKDTWTIHPGLLPEWLHAAVGHLVWPEDDAPAPSLFGVMLANVEWFDLAAAHPTQLTLTQQFDPAPSVEQIETAFALVKRSGGTPRMYVTLVPGERLDSPIEAQLEALYATWPETFDAPVDGVSAALGGPAIGPAERTTRFPDQILVSWEWMGFWTTTDDAAKRALPAE